MIFQINVKNFRQQVFRTTKSLGKIKFFGHMKCQKYERPTFSSLNVIPVNYEPSFQCCVQRISPSFVYLYQKIISRLSAAHNFVMFTEKRIFL